MSGRVVHKAYFPANGGFQLGGTEQPAPKPRTNRLRQSPPAVRTFGTRGQAFEHAAEVLARLKTPMRDLFQKARIGQALDEAVVGAVVGEIAGTMQSHPSALITLARLKASHEYAYLHAIAVCALMINLGKQLDLDQDTLKDLGTAGLLHDIGETLLPPSLLDRTGELSLNDFAIIRTHPARSHSALENVRGLPAVALDVALNHHERVDGRGYPDGVKDLHLSLEAKMAAICDVYDAVTSHRPYREAFSPPHGLTEMFEATGQFDPSLLAHFIRSVGVYPCGSLVRLESDHLAIVLEQSEDDLTKPVVRIFHSILDRARVPFRDIDLSKTEDDFIAGREEPRKWGFSDWDHQWPKLIRTD